VGNDGFVQLSNDVTLNGALRRDRVRVGTTTMRLALVASILLLAACAEPPRIGITISNTPAPIGACAPPKPGAGCP